MHTLIFGPSGSGKTYIASNWKRNGIPAFDAEDIKGLANWYDKQGNKISPKTAEEITKNNYSFLWSKKNLKSFLLQHPNAYILGGSGNISSMFDLFDKVYYLHVAPEILKQRIIHDKQTNRLQSKKEQSGNPIIWGNWFEDEAKELNIEFIDGTLSPMKLFEIINRD